MPGLPYAVPQNYVVRLVERGPFAEAAAANQGTITPDPEPMQPHPSHPSHFEFPRLSLHELTLRTHYRGPHSPASVSAPRSATAFSPPTDIRETMQYYHIEIEVPGVTDKESILIQWMSPHTLLVQGEAARPKSIGLLDESGGGSKVWEGASDAEAGAEKDDEDGGPLERTPSRETVEAQLRADSMPTVLLSERQLGRWRRTFTLPDDVEMRELKARLEGGLLRIDLPKRSIEDAEQLRRGGVKIQIE